MKFKFILVLNALVLFPFLISAQDESVNGNLTIGLVGGGSAGSLNIRRGNDGAPTGFLGYWEGGTESQNLAIANLGGSSYLTFITNSVYNGVGERMRISNEGNVGIGLTQPTEKLEVSNGKLKISNTLNPAGWIFNQFGFIQGIKEDGNVNVEVRTYGNSFFKGGNVGIGLSQPTEKLEVSDGIFKISNTLNPAGWIFTQFGFIQGIKEDGNANVEIRTYGNSFFNGGNVGIGTSTPSEQLQIGDRWVFHNGGHKIIGYNYTYINGLSKKLVDDESALIRFEEDGDIRFETVPHGLAGSVFSGSSSTIIKNNGNVGIGIIDPLYKLTVDGTISASEVKVSTTPNSDYVFEQDYNLKSLPEVESFIKENKHLPEIPSAEEFKQNGVGLGEMDDMLLRKIEELTLYSIEQNKSLKQQQRIIEEQQSQINSLFEIIKKLENE